MEKFRVARLVSILFLGAIILLAACSDGNEEPKADVSTNTDGASNNETVNNEDGELEPVTLLMVTHWGDEQFEFTFKEHLEEKYPHITLEHVQSGSGELEENVFAKDLKPDI